MDLNDVDLLSAFSQDPDPKTTQRQTSEYKEFTKSKNLHKSEESLPSAQEALRQAKAQVDQLQDSVTRAQLQLQKLAQAQVTQNVEVSALKLKLLLVTGQTRQADGEYAVCGVANSSVLRASCGVTAAARKASFRSICACPVCFHSRACATGASLSDHTASRKISVDSQRFFTGEKAQNRGRPQDRANSVEGRVGAVPARVRS